MWHRSTHCRHNHPSLCDIDPRSADTITQAYADIDPRSADTITQAYDTDPRIADHPSLCDTDPRIADTITQAYVTQIHAVQTQSPKPMWHTQCRHNHPSLSWHRSWSAWRLESGWTARDLHQCFLWRHLAETRIYFAAWCWNWYPHSDRACCGLCCFVQVLSVVAFVVMYILSCVWGSKLVFYAQSAITVISGRYTFCHVCGAGLH